MQQNHISDVMSQAWFYVATSIQFPILLAQNWMEDAGIKKLAFSVLF